MSNLSDPIYSDQLLQEYQQHTCAEQPTTIAHYMKSLVLRASNMVLPRCQPAITTYEQKPDAAKASSGGLCLRGLHYNLLPKLTTNRSVSTALATTTAMLSTFPVRSKQVSHLPLPETFRRPLRLLGFSLAAS